MAAPTIKIHPQSAIVTVGERVTFEVVAEGDGLQYQWKRDGTDVVSATQKSYELTVKQEDGGAKFQVLVKNADGERLSDPAVVTVVTEAPLLYDPKFARVAAGFLLAAFLVVLWPVWVIAGRVTSRAGDASQLFPAVIAVQLVIVGVLVALVGVYMALLDFRGRARTFVELKKAPEAAPGALGAVEEAAKTIPEAIKAFAQLKVPAALMLVSVVLFISAAAIAWRGVPSPSPSPEPSPTATEALASPTPSS